ncbi:MAG: formylglycine-generating enzyme family protein [Planctomycetaceae bacterium]
MSPATCPICLKVNLGLVFAMLIANPPMLLLAADAPVLTSGSPGSLTGSAIALGSRLGASAISAADDKTVTNSIGMKLVRIPAGEFQMGSPESDEEARDDEKPQHPVKITMPFLVGMYEVTQREYEAVQGNNPAWFSPSAGGRKKVSDVDTTEFPAERVSWLDAVEFCTKLSERPEEKAAGRRYRLLTEAEWQYCCRAGTASRYHFGDSLGSLQANINGRFPYGGAKRGPYLGRTTKVGSYQPNAFGLYDMHGNVGELCSDFFGREYYQQTPTDDPQGPEKGSDHLVMGGSWHSDAFRCRAAHRRSNARSGVASYFGFRVACEQQK